MLPFSISRLIISCVGLILCLNTSAQDPQFSQYYNNPIYLNPAYAGNTRQYQFIFNSRFQWTNTPARYVSNAFSAEGNFAQSNSGVALQVLHDRAGTGDLTYASAAGIYAYKAKLNRNTLLSIGLKGSLNQRYFDLSKLTLASDIADNQSNVGFNRINQKVSYADFGTGLIINTRLWSFGFAVDHLLRPNYQFGETNSKLPLKYSAHGSYEHVIARFHKKHIIKSITFSGNYKGQEEWDQLELGAYYTYYEVMAGLYYRGLPIQQTVPDNFNQDALILLVGYKWKGLKVFYSYDITVSRIYANTGGSHELSLVTIYPFNPKKRLRSHRMMPCPKF